MLTAAPRVGGQPEGGEMFRTSTKKPINETHIPTNWRNPGLALTLIFIVLLKPM
jgi:hypothetical protein